MVAHSDIVCYRRWNGTPTGRWNFRILNAIVPNSLGQSIRAFMIRVKNIALARCRESRKPLSIYNTNPNSSGHCQGMNSRFSDKRIFLFFVCLIYFVRKWYSHFFFLNNKGYFFMSMIGLYWSNITSVLNSDVPN